MLWLAPCSYGPVATTRRHGFKEECILDCDVKFSPFASASHQSQAQVCVRACIELQRSSRKRRKKKRKKKRRRRRSNKNSNNNGNNNSSRGSNMLTCDSGCVLCNRQRWSVSCLSYFRPAYALVCA